MFVLCCCGKTMQNTFKEFQFQSLYVLYFFTFFLLHSCKDPQFICSLFFSVSFKSVVLPSTQNGWRCKKRCDMICTTLVSLRWTFEASSAPSTRKERDGIAVNVNFPHCNNDLVASKIWLIRGLINFIWSIMNLWDCQPRNPQRGDYPQTIQCEKSFKELKWRWCWKDWEIN